jgi:glucose-1-phosphate thymidylyltransferase
VANRPIVDHVLDVLETVGAEEVIVAASARLAEDVRRYLSDQNSRRGARLRYLETPTAVDIDCAVRLVAPLIDGAPCIVHLASGLLDEPIEPLLDRLRGGSCDVILTAYANDHAETQVSHGETNVVSLASRGVRQSPLIRAGVCLFGPGALRREGPPAWLDDFDETDLTIGRIENAEGEPYVAAVKDWRQYAGDPMDLLELNRIALDRLEPASPQPHREGNRIEGRVRIHDLASIRKSVIIGPTVIGAGSQITNAYIGPYTSIGARARIEGAEIERSIIGADACISHVGGRLVASVVGRGARVFRDFSLPRALRLRVGDSTEVALC